MTSCIRIRREASSLVRVVAQQTLPPPRNRQLKKRLMSPVEQRVNQPSNPLKTSKVLFNKLSQYERVKPKGGGPLVTHPYFVQSSSALCANPRASAASLSVRCSRHSPEHLAGERTGRGERR